MLPLAARPAALRCSQARAFSTTNQLASQIGKTPIILPPGVKVEVGDVIPPPTRRHQATRHVTISGPNGSLKVTVPTFLDVSVVENKAFVSAPTPKVREHREMWGTVRALMQNHVTGVSEGHSAILRLVGVGYRAMIEDGGKKVGLKVGYSHPIELPIPEGVKASVPQPTRILLEGPDKHVLKQFAADIRAWRVPEPYKGKGIFINDETIKIKARKIK